MNSISCNNACCKFILTQHKEIVYTDDYYFTRNSFIKKAGCFIYDKRTNRILLVQSKGKYFGPPKGGIEENENILNAALREVREETGIKIHPKLLYKCNKILVNNTLFYIVNMKEIEVYPQVSSTYNDVNGIGWINIHCLIELILQNKITITKPVKIIIKKIFNVNINNFIYRLKYMNQEELKIRLKMTETRLIRELEL